VAKGARGTLNLPPPKENTPPRETPPAPQAPWGSLIAKRLSRSAPHPWTAITVPHQTIQVSPPPLCMPIMLASGRMPCTSHLSLRPPPGKAVSHRRPSLHRAGSQAYWAPRLVVPPSEPEFHTGNSPLTASPILLSNITCGDNSPHVHSVKVCAHREIASPSHSHRHAPMYKRGRSPLASRTFAPAWVGHTLARSSSHQRFQCKQCTAMAYT